MKKVTKTVLTTLLMVIMTFFPSFASENLKDNLTYGPKIPAVSSAYVQAGEESEKTMTEFEKPAYEADRILVKRTDRSQNYTRRAIITYDISNINFDAYNKFYAVLSLEKNEREWETSDIYTIDIPEAPLTYDSINDLGDSIGHVTNEDVDDDKKLWIDITDAVKAAREKGENRVNILIDNPDEQMSNGLTFFDHSQGENAPQLVEAKEDISQIKVLNLETTLGKVINPPENVTVVDSNGEENQEEVTWDEIDKSKFDRIGNIFVEGALTNYKNMPVELKITVKVPDDYESKTYYISNAGDDANDGLSEDKPWASFDKINEMTFMPGDQILLKSGDSWEGYIRPHGLGSTEAPITLGACGEGPRPIINGMGTKYGTLTGTILLENLENWIVDGLEITNIGTDEAIGEKFLEPYIRAGVLVYNTAKDTRTDGIKITNCYIHDVVSHTNPHLDGSSFYAKSSGGILALNGGHDIEGKEVADSKYNGYGSLEISYNIISNVMHEGIYIGPGANDDSMYDLKQNTLIHNNFIEKTMGDGIVVSNSARALIEHNVVKDCAHWDLNDNYYAAVWSYKAKDTIVQYNEVYGTRYGMKDSEAFDADVGNEGSIFQYNYSHDNWGGAVLLMAQQKNSVYRYNISANDGWGEDEEIINDHSTTAFTLTDQVPRVYNNTFYIDKNNGTNLYGSTTNKEFTYFKNNVVWGPGDVKIQFAKSNVDKNSIIENNLFKSYDMFTIYMPFSEEELKERNNLFGDPDLSNPAATEDHDKVGIESKGLDGISEIIANPIINLRNNAKDFMPNENSVLIGAGQEIDISDLAYDIMGEKIPANPTIGAMEYSTNEVSDKNILHPVETIDGYEIAKDISELSSSGKLADEEVEIEEKNNNDPNEADKNTEVSKEDTQSTETKTSEVDNSKNLKIALIIGIGLVIAFLVWPRNKNK